MNTNLFKKKSMSKIDKKHCSAIFTKPCFHFIIKSISYSLTQRFTSCLLITLKCSTFSDSREKDKCGQTPTRTTTTGSQQCLSHRHSRTHSQQTNGSAHRHQNTRCSIKHPQCKRRNSYWSRN